METPALEALLVNELRRRAGDLVGAYLFGSTARGESGPASDVDLALLYRQSPASTLAAQPFSLAADLASILGRNVDVVVLNTAPADLIHRVLRDGKLLVETDRSARIAFEVQARNLYFDMLPHWRRYRRQGAA